MNFQEISIGDVERQINSLKENVLKCFAIQCLQVEKDFHFFANVSNCSVKKILGSVDAKISINHKDKFDFPIEHGGSINIPSAMSFIIKISNTEELHLVFQDRSIEEFKKQFSKINIFDQVFNKNCTIIKKAYLPPQKNSNANYSFFFSHCFSYNLPNVDTEFTKKYQSEKKFDVCIDTFEKISDGFIEKIIMDCAKYKEYFVQKQIQSSIKKLKRIINSVC